MFFRSLMVAGLAGALSFASPQTAKADSDDFIKGAIVGGVVGYAIGKDVQKNKQKSKQQAATSSYSQGIPSTTQGAQTQTALNYFGFNAGSVDGQVGPSTRAAIERYQVAMDYPVNGRDFRPYQYDFLTQAYHWAISGGHQATMQLTGQPLLLAYRQQLQTGASATVANADTTTEETPTLPSLFAGGNVGPSLTNRCNAVMLQTSTHGGYTTIANMTNPDFTLSEQFCLARSYAIAIGEDKMSEITSLTPQEISAQCDALGATLSPQVDAVSLNSQVDVESEMRGFALSTGLEPENLAATSRVCLALGYSQDNMDTAIGSALMLVAMGEPAYGELVGHHLREGFGVAKRQDLAMQWYDSSLTALDQGSTAAFMPGQPERTRLIRAAMSEL